MVSGNNTASDISKFSKTSKYHKMVLLPNTTYRSFYYLFIIEAETFSVTHKRPLFRYGSQSFHVQTFSHLLVVLTYRSFVFLFTALTMNFCISPPEISGNLAAIVLKVKT